MNIRMDNGRAVINGRRWICIDTVQIEGEPMAKGRPRVTSTHAYTPKRTKQAQKKIVQVFQDLLGDEEGWPFELSCPVMIVCRFWHKRPQRLLRKKDPFEEIPKETKPDLDNLVKLAKDAINDCGYWADDKHNCTFIAEKMYCAKEEEPRTTIDIYILED